MNIGGESGWTVDTLAVYLDAEVKALRRLLDERQAAQLRSEERQESSIERRFASVNGFRAVLAEQQRTLLPRSEFDAQHKNVVDRMDVLSRMVSEAVTRDEAGIAGTRLSARIDEHQQRLDKREGRGSGLNQGWVYIVGGIATLGVIVALLNAFRIGV